MGLLTRDCINPLKMKLGYITGEITQIYVFWICNLNEICMYIEYMNRVSIRVHKIIQK